MKKYTADFETNVSVEKTRVWAVGLVDIETKEFFHGNDIQYLFDFFQYAGSCKVYFHNLKFDGEFIFYYLFEHGFTIVEDKKKMEPGTFTCLISGTGLFYSITIQLTKTIKIEILDSLKIIPFSVDQVAKAFGLPISKLEIDYKRIRPKGYELTENEVSYLKNDVMIMALALEIMFKQGLTAMTQGANAMKDFKNILGKKKFSRLFPPPVYDKELRQSYKGGFVYVNPKFQGKTVGEGIVLDVNSLYPSVMYYCYLPYGEGVYYDGEYKKDEIFPLYIQQLRCNFKLKERYIPTIQIKAGLFGKKNTFVEDSNGEDILLTLTNVDLELFLEHYEVYNIEYLGGWKFRSSNTIFKEYIDKWIKVKNEATIAGNYALRTLAKLMLNALYGKFAVFPEITNKYPYYDYKNQLVHYETSDPKQRDIVYIPMASFITAYARYKTITSAQRNIERFLYADTDSLHLLGTEIPDLEVDPVKLGAWKHEATFSRGKYLRQKSYIEEIDGDVKVTCAGMPKNCISLMKERGYTNDEIWDKFEYGSEFDGKLLPKHVSGGIVLVDTIFTLKS